MLRVDWLFLFDFGDGIGDTQADAWKLLLAGAVGALIANKLPDLVSQ